MSSETVCSKDQCNPANEVETGSEAKVSKPVPGTISCLSCVRAGFSVHFPESRDERHAINITELWSRKAEVDYFPQRARKFLKKFP